MSLFAAPLTKFTLEKNPNSDTLSIAQVGGWQCVVRTQDFLDETLGVYIPLEAIAAANHPLLGFLEGKPIKTCRLRGAISQGILLPYKAVVNYMKDALEMSEQSIEKVTVEGRDFAGILRVKRWYEPAKFGMGGDTEADDPQFNKYTDIENYRNFRNILQVGENVHISEKIHGSSARYSLIDGIFHIGSRNRQLKPESGKLTLWHSAANKYDIKKKLEKFSKFIGSKNVAIYGEIAGPKVQDLHYGCKEPSLFVYDFSMDGLFINPEGEEELAKQLGLQTCPVIKIGPYSEEDLNLRNGQSLLDTHIREGVVIKPLVPRWDSVLGRVVLKVISENYLLRKGAKDIQDF